MQKAAPSSQLLRFLARTCRDVPNHGRLSSREFRAPHHSCLRLHAHGSFLRNPSRGYATATSQPSESTESPISDSSTLKTTPNPDITNHYTLFPTTLPSGPPPTGPFAINARTLRSEFLRLQSHHHPDKFPPGTPQHKTSLALSALLNNAYRTLSDPLLRAQYLLIMRYDIDVMSEDNSSHPTDQGTLVEVMEAQEGIEDAQDQAEIDRLKKENSARIEETVEKMAKAFEAEDGETAKNECVRLKYWRSLQDGLHSWEPGKEVRLIH